MISYALLLETSAYVDDCWLVGIGKDKEELWSLTYDMFNYIGERYEDIMTYFEWTVYKISESDATLIDNILDQYVCEIEKYTEDICNFIGDDRIEDYYGIFKFLKLRSDNVIFSNKDIKSIFNIFEKSEKLL